MQNVNFILQIFTEFCCGFILSTTIERYYSLVYTKANESSFHQIFVLGTWFPKYHYIPRRKSGIYWIQVRRAAAAAAAVEISLWTR